MADRPALIDIEGNTQSFPSAAAAREHLLENGWMPQTLGDRFRSPSQYHFVTHVQTAGSPSQVKYAHIIES